MKNGFSIRGKHLILDIVLQKAIEQKQLKELLNRLPDRIAMKKLAPVKTFKSVDYPHGVSGIVPITTSHIATHSYEYTRGQRNGITTLAFDCYSCENYPHLKVMKTLHELLGRYQVIQKKVIPRFA